MKFIFVFVTLLSCIYNVNSQIIITETPDNEKIIIRNSADSVRRIKPVKSVWKIDVIAPAYGKLGVAYEREISSLFAVEAEAGGTYFNAFELAMAGFGSREVVSDEGYRIDVPRERSDNVFRARPGYFINVTPKIYYLSIGFEGGFIGVNAFYNRWNYSQDVDGGGKLKTCNNQVGGFLQIGGQKLYGYTVLNYSFNIGLSRNNATGYYSDISYQGKVTYSYLAYHFGVSLKVGSAFEKTKKKK